MRLVPSLWACAVVASSFASTAPGAKAGVVRLVSKISAANGTASVPVNNISAQSSGLPSHWGGTVDSQALFADPLAGGAGIHSSNGLRMQLCP